MPSNLAVVLVDPLNDFLHPDGKLYSLVKRSLEANRTVEHMQVLVQHARNANIPIFYALHQQIGDESMAGWKHLNSSLLSIKKNRVFEEGSWGAKILDGMEPRPSNGDVVVSRHWNSRLVFGICYFLSETEKCSSFANTDLDYQLRQHDITHLVLAGMATNTCLESTARHSREL